MCPISVLSLSIVPQSKGVSGFVVERERTQRLFSEMERFLSDFERFWSDLRTKCRELTALTVPEGGVRAPVLTVPERGVRAL